MSTPAPIDAEVSNLHFPLVSLSLSSISYLMINTMHWKLFAGEKQSNGITEELALTTAFVWFVWMEGKQRVEREKERHFNSNRNFRRHSLFLRLVGEWPSFDYRRQLSGRLNVKTFSSSCATWECGWRFSISLEPFSVLFVNFRWLLTLPRKILLFASRTLVRWQRECWRHLEAMKTCHWSPSMKPSKNWLTLCLKSSATCT